MAGIVLNTFGSLGDLHPYLAVALLLKRRGHHPIIATSEIYRAKVEATGLDFAAVRPDVGELMDRPDFVKLLWDAKHGSKYLLRDYVIPAVEQSFHDLRNVCAGADLLLTHGAGYAGPIVAELLKLRWISVALQPAIFFSALDPSVVAPAPWLRHFNHFGPGFSRLLLAIADRQVSGWINPILQLRKRLGLPAPHANPVMRGQFSPLGTLALFSSHFARPQLDWPARTLQTGFVFYDQKGEGLPGPAPELPHRLNEFLAAGEPPILFTLGSSAVMQAGRFYLESIKAMEAMNQRAILLIGLQDLPVKLPPSIFAAGYLPYSQVMPHVSAIVHQGGIGTTAQGLRAGKPMLVVPWAHDQPDNAERLRKLGVARSIPRSHYRASQVQRELRLLLGSPLYADSAAGLGDAIAAEQGGQAACDGIDSFLSMKPSD